MGGISVILRATGSGEEIALKARDVLKSKNMGTRLASMPAWNCLQHRIRLAGARPWRVLSERHRLARRPD